MAGHGHDRGAQSTYRKCLAAAYGLHRRTLFLACILLLCATSSGPVAAKTQTQCTSFTPNASAFPITWTVYQNWTFSDRPPTTNSYTQSMPDLVGFVGNFGLNASSIFQSCNGAFTPVTAQWVQQPTATNFFTYNWTLSLSATGVLTITESGLSNTPPTGNWPTATSYSATENATWVFTIPTGAYTVTQTDGQSVTFTDNSGELATGNEVGSGGTNGVVPVVDTAVQLVSPFLLSQNLNNIWSQLQQLYNQQNWGAVQAQGLMADNTSAAIAVLQTSDCADAANFSTSGGVLIFDLYQNQQFFQQPPPSSGAQSLTVPQSEFTQVGNQCLAAVAVQAPPNSVTPNYSLPAVVMAQQSGGQPATASMPFVPPPVLLIHGLWGDVESLSYYKDKLTTTSAVFKQSASGSGGSVFGHCDALSCKGSSARFSCLLARLRLSIRRSAARRTTTSCRKKVRPTTVWQAPGWPSSQA
jgi:hypothetical protein